jgi:hypothetical protein
MFLFNGSYVPPYVAAAEARSENSIEISFDKEISPASAIKLSNYYIHPEIDPQSRATLTGAALGEGGTSVLVTFEEPLVWDDYYVIGAGGIKDVNGYTILQGADGSEITFMASENTATLLAGFAARRIAGAVEISWELSEMDDGVAFHVLRGETPAPDFIELPREGIASHGLKFTFEDRTVERGSTYRYRIIYDDGTASRTLFETDEITVPALRLSLGQNHPNPFNPLTAISYVLPADGHVRLDVYDVTGRHVKTLVDAYMTKGEHTADWNGLDESGNLASSGVYFYILAAGKQVLTRKMILMR